MSHVLIVEDDADAARMMAALVRNETCSVATAHSLREAREQAAARLPDVVLLDLKLPDGNGLDVFDDPIIKAHSEVVLITGHASVETSIQAFKLGAADYLLKPVSAAQLEAVMSRVMPPAKLNEELGQLHVEWERSGRFGHLWGRSEPMQRIYHQLSRVAGTAVTVMLTGESGTGKELVARTVHDLSRRRRAPFLAVNCGAISPHLIESELFGHERGSFTGAERQHIGFFERARGGTLFLDEITEMPLDLQVKLLRVLEVGGFMRVGSTEVQEADVRVIAATNRPPEQAVADGRLREDLYYRLNVFPLNLPPLRQRRVDIELLAEKFLAEVSKREGATKRFSADAIQQLSIYRWPGNVRELRNVVQRTYVMTSGDVIGAEWLPLNSPHLRDSTAGDSSEIRIPIGSTMAEAERQLILATIGHFKNKERAAAVLGVSMKTLYNRMKEYAKDESASESPSSMGGFDADSALGGGSPDSRRQRPSEK